MLKDPRRMACTEPAVGGYRLSGGDAPMVASLSISGSRKERTFHGKFERANGSACNKVSSHGGRKPVINRAWLMSGAVDARPPSVRIHQHLSSSCG
jgi:hypothetical protein